MTLPLKLLLFSFCIAARASCPSISINPNPLHFFVNISVINFIERTFPQVSKRATRSWSMVSAGKFPINIFFIFNSQINKFATLTVELHPYLIQSLHRQLAHNNTITTSPELRIIQINGSNRNATNCQSGSNLDAIQQLMGSAPRVEHVIYEYIAEVIIFTADGRLGESSVFLRSPARPRETCPRLERGAGIFSKAPLGL